MMVCDWSARSRCSRCQPVGKRRQDTTSLYHLIGHSGSTGLLPRGLLLIICSREPTMYGGEPFLVRIGAVCFSDSDTDLIILDQREALPRRFLRETDQKSYLNMALALGNFNSAQRCISGRCILERAR